MGSVRVSKGEEIEVMAKRAEEALKEKGEIWTVEVDGSLARRRLPKKGCVTGSMLGFLWLIRDLGYEFQVDPEKRRIRIVPPDT